VPPKNHDILFLLANRKNGSLHLGKPSIFEIGESACGSPCRTGVDPDHVCAGSGRAATKRRFNGACTMVRFRTASPPSRSSREKRCIAFLDFMPEGQEQGHVIAKT